jgi:CRISPR-associated protein Csm2
MMSDYRQQQRGNSSGTGYSRDNHQEPGFRIGKDELKEILDGKNPSKMVTKAEDIAKFTVQSKPPLTTSQIRNIYGTVKKLEMVGDREDVIAKLILLKPKLAYAYGRNDKVQGLRILKDILSDAIDLVAEKKEVRFQNFCRFFEAILAYHRAEGGK